MASRCSVFVPRKCIERSVTLGPPWVKCILHVCSNISMFPGTFMYLATFIFLNPFLFHITKCRILDSNMGTWEPHALPRWLPRAFFWVNFPIHTCWPTYRRFHDFVSGLVSPGHVPQLAGMKTHHPDLIPHYCMCSNRLWYRLPSVTLMGTISLTPKYCCEEKLLESTSTVPVEAKGVPWSNAPGFKKGTRHFPSWSFCRWDREMYLENGSPCDLTPWMRTKRYIHL